MDPNQKGGRISLVSYPVTCQKLNGARPGRLELPTLCLEVTQYKTLSAASGVAYKGARHLSRP